MQMKAAYNSFVVVDCKKRKTVFVTQSARKAREALTPGFRIEVWNSGYKVETIYYKDIIFMSEYCIAEKEYIKQKQHNHEMRNERRRCHGVESAKPEEPRRPTRG